MKLAKMVKVEKWSPIGHEGGWHFRGYFMVPVARLGRMWAEWCY